MSTPPNDPRRELIDEVIDEALDDDRDFEPYDDYSERDLEELAADAADRYERGLFGED